MKVAVLSESSADEAAIRVLVEGLIARKTDLPPHLPVRWRGIHAVFKVLEGLLSHLHYRTDVEALCVVVDSDRSPVHDSSHEVPGNTDPECRLCKLRSIVAMVRTRLRLLPGRAAIKTAIGLAVPQIEAWYLAGRDPHVNEAIWTRHLKSGLPPDRRKHLKISLYGTDRPQEDHATECARKEAERIVRDGHLPLLEKLFPVGFGALASDVRAWRTQG